MSICTIVIFISRCSPLVGFYGKFFIFYNLTIWSNFSLFLFVLVVSVISSIYYIRIIQVLFFSNIRLGSSLINIPWVIGASIVLFAYLNVVECILSSIWNFINIFLSCINFYRELSIKIFIMHIKYCIE